MCVATPNMQKIVRFHLIAALLLMAPPCAAQMTQERATLSAGGGTLTAPQYILTGSIGQASPVGVLTTGTLTLQAGFFDGGSAAPRTYALTVRLAGTGSGRVTGAGIACGADCVETYAAGTTIELTAMPALCSRAVRWEDEAGVPLATPLTIASDSTVVAVFDACCPAPVMLLSPADGAVNVPIDAPLTWQAADGASSYDVYLGATDPLAKQTNTLDVQYALTGLTLNTAYRWRVDAVNSCGITPGTVRTFTTVAQTDTVPPVVTLSVTPDTIVLGQSVTITTTATDNVGVTEFHLTVNGTEIATAPGTATYTPSAVGTYSALATTKDAAGNEGATTKTCLVNEAPPSITTAIKYYEGFDPLNGVVERDRTVLVFTPQTTTDMTDIPNIPGIERFVTFSDAVAFHVEFHKTAESSILFVTEPNVQAALLTGIAFETLSAQQVKTLAFGEWPNGHAVSSDHVVALSFTETANGTPTYFKIGHFQTNLATMTITFTYQELIP